MSINLTMLGQLISFTIFVLICMKYVWPPLIEIMRERQQKIADGLERAAKAEAQLEQANEAAAKELDEAKAQSAQLIEQGNRRAAQIVEEAKTQAREEGDRLIQAAQAEIDQEINRAKEALRAQVSVLALQGAEKILETTVDRDSHRQMLDKLAAEL